MKTAIYQDELFVNQYGVAQTLEEFFEDDDTAYFIINFKDCKQRVKEWLLPHFRVQDYGSSIHVDGRTIGDFKAKFCCENIAVADLLAAESDSVMDTAVGDGINDFVRYVGHKNYLVGANTLKKIYPALPNEWTISACEKAKVVASPYTFVRPGDYTDVYEIDLKNFYRNIVLRTPLPHGRALDADAGTTWTMYEFRLFDPFRDRLGFFNLRPGWNWCGEQDFKLLARLMGERPPIRHTLTYKASLHPLADYFDRVDPYAAPCPEVKLLRKMKLNTLLGNFGRKRNADGDGKPGYLPVWIAVLNTARAVMAQTVEICADALLYANTDSVFMRRDLSGYLTARTGYTWQVKHHFNRVVIRGINDYTEMLV